VRADRDFYYRFGLRGIVPRGQSKAKGINMFNPLRRLRVNALMLTTAIPLSVIVWAGGGVAFAEVISITGAPGMNGPGGIPPDGSGGPGGPGTRPPPSRRPTLTPTIRRPRRAATAAMAAMA
jgi:hypothetical protein